MRVESELRQKLEIPVRERDARRQNLVIVEVLPALRGPVNVLPERRILCLCYIERVVDRCCARCIRKLGFLGSVCLDVANQHFLVDRHVALHVDVDLIIDNVVKVAHELNTDL